MAVIRADNYFAILPEWVLDAPISAQAIRLYCVLARFAGKNGQCFPTRKTIADRMQASTGTVDRAMQELADLGAVLIHQRFVAGSSEPTSNAYTVITAPPMRRGLLTDGETLNAREETGLLTGDEQNRATLNESHQGDSIAHASVSMVADQFAAFWRTYPRKVGKAAALKRWKALSATHRSSAIGALPAHVARWQNQRIEARFIPHPATWLSQGRWDDDLSTEATNEPTMPGAVRHAATLYERARRAEMVNALDPTTGDLLPVWTTWEEDDASD